MLLPDHQIRKLALDGMIAPFSERTQPDSGLSFGLSSAGYDARLGGTLRVAVRNAWADSWQDRHGPVFQLTRGEFVLAYTVERFRIPDDVLGVVLGKSSLARQGVIVNATPLEPGWEGHITLELSATGAHPVELHAGHGIAQVLFMRIDGRPSVTYGDRAGKYQNQPAVPTQAILHL